MSWLRIDDGFAQHPKVVQLAPRDRWTWLELLCYCARYRTGGRIPEAISAAIRNAKTELLARYDELGLLDKDEHGYIVHDWAIYNADTIGEKVDAYLATHPEASANEVQRAIGGKREIVLAEVERFHTGSQNGSLGTTKPVPKVVPKTVPDRYQSGSRARTRPVPS